MQLTHDNDCPWRLGHDCNCEKSDHRDATITRLTAELEAAKAALHGPIAEVGPEEMAAIIAHLSPELEPRSPLPNSNSLMMAIIREKVRAEAAEALLARAYEAGRDDAGEKAADRLAACGARDIAGLVKAHIVRMKPPADLAARLGGAE